MESQQPLAGAESNKIELNVSVHIRKVLTRADGTVEVFESSDSDPGVVIDQQALGAFMEKTLAENSPEPFKD